MPTPLFTSLVAAAAVLVATCAVAQTGGQTAAVLMPPPQNVLTLSANATVEVPKDWLAVTLSTTREAPDATTVQTQLKAALDAALTEARKAVKPGQVEVRTGGFSIYPRYAPNSRTGAISGWQGSAELVIEGRDTATLSQLAGKLNTMTVARTGFTLSREAREKVEGEVSATAIARFRAQADAYAKQFGFAGYTVREVNVNTGGDGPMQPVPVFRAQAMQATVESPLPVEAGRANVTATVSGSVQMSIR